MKTMLGVSSVGISFFLLCGTGFPLELQESGVEQEAKKDNKEKQQITMDQDRLRKNDPDVKEPMIPPPTDDPGMVIPPDLPPDPDAVITPPPVDPDTAVDPATREPLTREAPENLNKHDQSDEATPDQRQRGLSQD